MARVPIPPPHEPLSAEDSNRANDTWYRYWESNSRGLESVTSGLSTLPAISTATTYAQTILATTTSSQVRTILGVDAADTVGSWTPGLAIAGTTIVTDPSVAVGRYIRSASGSVSAWGTITVTTLGLTTGALTVTGLPVNASSTTAGIKFSGSIGHFTGITIGGTMQSLVCHVTTGSSVVTMGYMSNTLAGFTPLPSTVLTTAASLSLTVSYETSL